MSKIFDKLKNINYLYIMEQKITIRKRKKCDFCKKKVYADTLVSLKVPVYEQLCITKNICINCLRKITNSTRYKEFTNT